MIRLDNDISLDPKLFELVKSVYDKKDSLTLSQEIIYGKGKKKDRGWEPLPST